MRVLQSALRVFFPFALLAVSILSLLPPQSGLTLDIADKLQHLAAYAFLAMIGAIAFPSRRGVVVLAVFLAAYATAMEGAQTFVAGRTAEVGDAIASFAGIGLGVVMVSGGRQLSSRQGSRRAQSGR